MKTLLASLALALAPGPVLPPQSFHAQDDRIERLDSWPELDKELRAQVKTDVARLRKARTPEMGEQAFDGLVAAGAGAAPDLLDALDKEKDEEARARITDVLVTITGAPHTRLLAQHFGAGNPVLRRFALRRAALFPDAGTLAPAEEALEKARNPGKDKTPDPDDLLAAALAATAAGSLSGLEALYLAARTDWPEESAAIHVAATAVRGEEASKRMLPHVASSDRNELLAGLRLLAACGTRADAASGCAKHLDSADNGVRIAAINALRGIVDGAPPLEHLSAFDAIEMAQQWKRRIQ